MIEGWSQWSGRRRSILMVDGPGEPERGEFLLKYWIKKGNLQRTGISLRVWSLNEPFVEKHNLKKLEFSRNMMQAETWLVHTSQNVFLKLRMIEQFTYVHAWTFKIRIWLNTNWPSNRHHVWQFSNLFSTVDSCCFDKLPPIWQTEHLKVCPYYQRENKTAPAPLTGHFFEIEIYTVHHLKAE